MINTQKMKQVWIGRIVKLVTAGLLVSTACSAQEPIMIGLSVPLSGKYANDGRMIKNGVELAVKQVNAAGGIQGRPLEIVEGDSQFDPDMSKRIARKFVSNPKIVAEIGDYSSSCSMAAQPVYDKAGMVQLSPTSSHPAFTLGSPFSFSIVGTDAGDSPFMARMAVERLGKKRIAVAYLQTDYDISMKTLFVEEAKRLGAEIVAEESYIEGTTDFSAMLHNLRAKNPEVLFLAALAPDVVRISQQRQQDGWEDVVVMGSLPLTIPELMSLGGAAVENMFVPAFFFPNDPRPEVQHFVKAYQAAYETDLNWFAAVGYDALNLLVDAIKQSGADRKAIQQTLAAVKEYSGVTGKIIFSEYRNVVNREYTLLQVKQGQFVLFEGQ